MAPPSIAALPHAIVALVFGFITADTRENDRKLTDTVAESSLPLPTDTVPLALVARDWHALALNLHCKALLQTLHIISWSKTKRDVLDVRRQLTLRRGVLDRLAIFDLSTSACGLWEAALAHATRLSSLRVYGPDVGYSNVQLAEIVLAAGRYSPHIKRLELPPFVNNKPSYPAYEVLPHTELEEEEEAEEEREEEEHQIDCPPLESVASIEKREERVVGEQIVVCDPVAGLSDAVFTSATAWKRHGRAGLRHLVLSAHDLTRDVAAANAYLAKIAECCPDLEILDGCEAMHQREGNGEKWTIDLATWDLFARSCTRFKTFTWLPVPFATSFFEVFGRYEKPQLTKLTIATTERWNWAKHLNELGVDDRCQLLEAGYASTARHTHAVLRACPNLTALEIQCFFPTVSLTSVMNVDEFGDAFCEAMATHCRKLTSFTILPRYGYWTRPGSVATFTDRSMIALAQLQLLNSVNVTGANITGDGLYALVVNRASTALSSGAREYEFRIGYIHDSDSRVIDHLLFYRILQRFLERLGEETQSLEELMGTRRVTLRLINEGGARLDEGWLLSYLETNEKLRAEVQAKHPSVVIQQTSKGKIMWGIRDFSFSLNA